MDRALDFVAGGDDGVLYADSIRSGNSIATGAKIIPRSTSRIASSRSRQIATLNKARITQLAVRRDGRKGTLIAVHQGGDVIGDDEHLATHSLVLSGGETTQSKVTMQAADHALE